MSEIIINKMSSQFNLVGYRESVIDVGITVGIYLDSDIPIEINTRAMSDSIKNVEMDVVCSGYESIYVELTPALHNSISVEIEVSPHNKMSVYYELTQPPLSTFTGFSVEDAFVAERNPYAVMNYGSNNSMMVGQDHKGENISFVKFDVSIIDENVMIKSAKMRLYYSQLSGSDFELYRVMDKWREVSITYANMPINLRPLTDESMNNTEDRCIEFDVTDIVSSYIKGVPNEGFALKSSNEVSILRTREYDQPPELIVEYYSPSTLSVGNSRRQVELTVRQKNTNDIPVEIDVHSDFGFSWLPVTIFSKKPDDIFNSDIPIEIDTVAAPLTNGHSDISVEITTGQELMYKVDVEIEVPIYDGESDVPVEIAVRRNNESVVNIDIEVPLYNEDSNVDIELTVQRYNESYIPIDIEVPMYNGESNIRVEINIGNYHDSDIDAEIEVPQYTGESSIPVEITLWEYTESVVPVDIAVTRESIDVGITIPYYDDSTVNVEVIPRVPYLNEITVEVMVRRKYRYAYAFMI